MPSIAGISYSPSSSLTWSTANVTVSYDNVASAYSVTTDLAGDAYNKIAFANVASTASSGGFMRINFNNASGFAYVGLTQSLTSTSDSVDQYLSKVDVGIKLDVDNVFVVKNGAEITPIGKSDSVYTILSDGDSGFVIFKDSAVAAVVANVEISSFASGSPLKAAVVAYSQALGFQVEAGSYSSSTLAIGGGGIFDAISAESNIVLESTTGELTLKIKIPTGETASYSYEVAQLGGLPVTETFLSSTATESGGFLSKTLTNSDFVGADIQVVKVSENGIRSSPFTVTTKIINHYDVQTAGVVLTDAFGAPYKSIALLLGNTYISTGITHLAVIDPNLYTSAIQTAGQVSVGVDDVTILPIGDGMVKLDITSSSTKLFLPGTLDNTDPNILNINSNFPKFAVYGGSIQNMFDIAQIDSLTAPAFQAGSNVDVTVTWSGATTSNLFYVFTQGIDSLFYADGTITSIPGYYGEITASNNVLQFTAPANNTYYVYPVQYDQNGGSIYFLAGHTTISLAGTLWPPGAFPRAPVVDSIDTTTTPGSAIISWTQPAGDSNYADAVSFSILIKDENEQEVLNEQSVTSPFTTSGLTIGSYQLYIIAYSAENTSIQTSPQTFSVTGGGGGGGGGGGNTGGNGHNNMATPATLELNYLGYEGTATQNNTITVLGEDHGVLTGEVITINVTGSALQAVLAYDSNWSADATGDASGTQPQPKVKFLPSACSEAIEAMYAKLKVVGEGVLDSATRKFTDDASAQVPVFGNELLGLSFTNSALDDDEMPRESIRQIEEGGITGPAALLDVCVDLDTEVAAAGDKPEHAALLKGLFEQAVAAGKVVTSDPAHATETGYKMPSLAAGDTISFPVKFHFSKTRTYALDSDVSSGAGGSALARSITIPGVNSDQPFSIDAVVETSDPYSKTYIIKLVAV